MRFLVLALLALGITAAHADNYHRGYVRSDGTYVQPHYQTAPDRNPFNNYSSQGNTNPYTGQSGSRDPYAVQQQYGGQHNYPDPFRATESRRDRSRW